MKFSLMEVIQQTPTQLTLKELPWLQCPYHQSFELQQLVSEDNRKIRNIQSVLAAKLDLGLIGKAY